MAKNRPYGDNRRIGAVKNRVQHFNPKTGRWVKFNTQTGRIMDMKSDSKPFKGVRKK